MKRKVCPICDKVMKVPCYCGTCKKIVLHPYERNATYYLNERRPVTETDRGLLFYDDDGRQDVMTAGRWEDILKIPSQSAVQEEQKPAERLIRWLKDKNRWLVVLIGCYLIFVVIATITLVAGNMADSRDDRNWPEDYIRTDEPAGETEAETEEFYHEWELSDEEVISRGEACSDYGHLAVTAGLLEPVLLDCLSSGGYDISRDEPWSYNLVYDEISSYNTLVDYGVYDGEDRWIGSLSLLYDTATKEIHEIDIDTRTREDLVYMMKEAVTSLEDTGIIPKSLEFPQKLERGLNPGSPENAGSVPDRFDLETEDVVIQCQIDDEHGIWNYRGIIAARTEDGA